MLEFPLRNHISKIKWKSEFVNYACWKSQCGRCIFKTCAFCTHAPSRNTRSRVCILNDTTVNRCKILFLEASVNRIKIYCNRFFIETLSSIFTREQKIANNWRHFIISTQTGSHEKSRISLIHFCSNIHSFTVLDYMYTGLYISFKIFIMVIYIFIWWLLHTVHIHLIGKVFFLYFVNQYFF